MLGRHATSVTVSGNTATYSGVTNGVVQGTTALQQLDGVPVIYYEVTIDSIGQKGAIGVGFAPSTYGLNMQPGWGAKSIGMHGDDGCIYVGNQPFRVCGKYANGSVIGCGFVPETKQVFYTFDGKLVLPPKKAVIPTLEFFPTVGFHSPGEKVTFNFQQPFKFDFAQLVLAGILPLTPPEGKTDLFRYHSGLLKVEGNVITHVGPKGSGPASAIALLPLKPVSVAGASVPYFEVTIKSIASGFAHVSGFAVGLAGKDSDFELDKLPGHKSVAYHGDGHLFDGTGLPVASVTRYHYNGLRLGIGFDAKTRQVFIMGGNVGPTPVSLTAPAGEQVYAVIGLLAPGDSVAVNFGAPNPSISAPTFVYPSSLWRPSVAGDAIYTEREIARYVKEAQGGRVAVGASPLAKSSYSPSYYYFETTVLSTGKKGQISIGMVPAALSDVKEQKDAKAPGRTAQTFGIDGETGTVYANGAATSVSIGKLATGSVVGCGYLDDPSRNVFFTHNQRVYRIPNATAAAGDHFPVVCLNSYGETVGINMGGAFHCTRERIAASPSVWGRMDTSKLKAEGDVLTAIQASAIQSQGVAIAQSATELKTIYAKSVFYYEVTVLSLGKDGIIGVGIAKNDYPLHRMPGWDATSFGYHGDDGKFFNGTGDGAYVLGAKFEAKDVIGCGFHQGTKELFFTRNGTLMKVKSDYKVPTTTGFYATVGLWTKTMESAKSVSLNLGDRPFLFNFKF